MSKKSRGTVVFVVVVAIVAVAVFVAVVSGMNGSALIDTQVIEPFAEAKLGMLGSC